LLLIIFSQATHTCFKVVNWYCNFNAKQYFSEPTDMWPKILHPFADNESKQ